MVVQVMTVGIIHRPARGANIVGDCDPNDNNNNNNNNETDSCDEYDEEGRPNLLWLLVFLLLFPIAPFVIGCVMGGIMSATENAAFTDGFLYVISNILQFSEPLVNFNPNNGVGVTLDVYVSVLALICFGVILNVIHIFRIPELIDDGLSIFTRYKFLRVILAFLLVIPACVSIIAVTFGSLLAWAENWTVQNGILYVFGNLLGLGNPLVAVSPKTFQGDLIDIFISSIALGCVALFIDYVNAINVAKYLRRRISKKRKQQRQTTADTGEACPQIEDSSNMSSEEHNA